MIIQIYILNKFFLEIGKIYQQLKDYSKAKHYFSKMLEYSWILNDKNHESQAYDLLGISYYYLGKLKVKFLRISK